MWLLLPAAISFFIKIAILWFARETVSFGRPTILLGLILICAMHNVCEFLTYSNFLAGKSPDLLFRSYYVLLCGMLAYMLAYAAEVSNLKPKWLYPLLVAICTIVGSAILFTDLVVAGYTTIGYSITAIRAEHYWLFQLTALPLLISTAAVLIAGYIKSDEHIIQIRCLYTLLGLAPLIICIISVIVLMAMGFKINAMMIIPISSTLFILITLKTEAQHRLTDVRRMIPYSIERTTSNEIQNVISNYAMENKSHKEAIADIEKLLVVYKNTKTGNNVSKTAESMGLPRSTVYAIFKRLEISREQEGNDKAN